MLANKVFDAATVTAIMTDAEAPPLEPSERAMMAFVEKVVLDALGVQADSAFNDLDPTLRQAPTVGRPVADRPE